MKTKLFFMVIILCLSLSFNVFAAKDTIQPTAAPIDRSTVSSQADSFLFDGGPIQGAKKVRPSDSIYRFRLSEKLSTEDSTNTVASATWLPLSGVFPYYAQEYSYSCGPATVRMALDHINGTTPNEATVRTACKTNTSGTYLDDMRTYLNSMQSARSYEGYTQDTLSYFKDNLYNAIVTYDVPPICGVKETTSNGWPFNIDIHTIAVYSTMSDKSYFALCDPWGGYIGMSSYRWYDKSASVVHSAMNASLAGYLY